MQAAFTKKTQEIAQAKKEAEAIRQKAEAYEKYQQHIPIIEEMLKGQRDTKSPELLAIRQMYKNAGYTDDVIDAMEMGLGYVLDHVNQSQAAKAESERITSQIQEASKLDPRLTDQELVYQTADGEKLTFGQVVEQMVAADPKWKENPVAATKRAIARVDALIGRAKTEGKEELSNLAKGKAQKFPAIKASPQSASNAGNAPSIRDAYKQAQAETGITLKG